eukprot:CAMPEP_0170549932 /NCGR_PEP_ID=MMETSP0211-20121228/8021_1 /TAXON_ID=311385 /ORGANISM="Pseudokeronopsis sp., Strain OXSARD2" /LENGTH=77 /DNA_ID=CAMNT_0010856183 /DNA_START=515 /DNA_END=748 /DNA_ORIENTATION=-
MGLSSDNNKFEEVPGKLVFENQFIEVQMFEEEDDQSEEQLEQLDEEEKNDESKKDYSPTTHSLMVERNSPMSPYFLG